METSRWSHSCFKQPLSERTSASRADVEHSSSYALGLNLKISICTDTPTGSKFKKKKKWESQAGSTYTLDLVYSLYFKYHVLIIQNIPWFLFQDPYYLDLGVPTARKNRQGIKQGIVICPLSPTRHLLFASSVALDFSKLEFSYLRTSH